MLSWEVWWLAKKWGHQPARLTLTIYAPTVTVHGAEVGGVEGDPRSIIYRLVRVFDPPIPSQTVKPSYGLLTMTTMEAAVTYDDFNEVLLLMEVA